MQSVKPIHTLWTGGLDSTARIVELSRKDIVIQPYYIIDDSRASTGYELRAMNLITERIRSDKNTIAQLNDLIIIRVADIRQNDGIRKAWELLNKKYKIGSQYEFLARYADQNDIILELGVEKGEGRAQTSIFSESKMVKFHDETGDNYHVLEDASSLEAWQIYQHFTFPLWERNKHQEVEMMKELGCEDIVRMTWFCHSLLLGKPYGHCNLCRDAKHYGFAWRLSKSRYFLWYFARPRTSIKYILKKFVL